MSFVHSIAASRHGRKAAAMMCVPATKSVSKMLLQISLLLAISAADRVDYSGYQVGKLLLLLL